MQRLLHSDTLEGLNSKIKQETSSNSILKVIPGSIQCVSKRIMEPSYNLKMQEKIYNDYVCLIDDLPPISSL